MKTQKFQIELAGISKLVEMEFSCSGIWRSVQKVALARTRAGSMAHPVRVTLNEKGEILRPVVLNRSARYIGWKE